MALCHWTFWFLYSSHQPLLLQSDALSLQLFLIKLFLQFSVHRLLYTHWFHLLDDLSGNFIFIFLFLLRTTKTLDVFHEFFDFLLEILADWFLYELKVINTVSVVRYEFKHGWFIGFIFVGFLCFWENLEKIIIESLFELLLL